MCAGGRTTSLSPISQYKSKCNKLSEKICSRLVKMHFCSFRITQIRVIKDSPFSSAKTATLIFTTGYKISKQASLTPKIMWQFTPQRSTATLFHMSCDNWYLLFLLNQGSERKQALKTSLQWSNTQQWHLSMRAVANRKRPLWFVLILVRHQYPLLPPHVTVDWAMRYPNCSASHKLSEDSGDSFLIQVFSTSQAYGKSKAIVIEYSLLSQISKEARGEQYFQK